MALTSASIAGCEHPSGPAPPAEDWSGATAWVTYQGNDAHTGHVPVTADTAAFEPAWMVTPLPGAVLNQPTEAAGLIIITPSYASNTMVALDAATGATVWKRDFPTSPETQSLAWPFRQPTFRKDLLYLTSGEWDETTLWALRASDGTEVFRYVYGNHLPADGNAAPAVVDGTVYVQAGGNGGVIAVSTVDGSRRWLATGVARCDHSDLPCAIAAADGKVYGYSRSDSLVAGNMIARVTALDAVSGEVLWGVSGPTPAASVHSSVWLWSIPSVTLGTDGTLLIADVTALWSLDPRTQSVLWSRQSGYGGDVTVANGFVYVVHHAPGDRSVWSVDAVRETNGELLWRWSQGGWYGARESRLLALDNLLFVGGRETTYAVDLRTGKTVWSYPTAGRMAVTSGGLLLIAGLNGTVTAIRLRDG